ncbi:hypothetical protein [Flavobacterium sp. Leaf359]|nr:hypothetical protein [Flavobacterium sp. Leaf359]
MYQDDKDNNNQSQGSGGSQQNNPDRDTGRYEERSENQSGSVRK